MAKPMFDVVAVDTATSKILWVMGPQDAANAEAIYNMAIMRQGVENRFFAYAQPRQYTEGDVYEGGVELPPQDPNYITSGAITYPRGPRGL